MYRDGRIDNDREESLTTRIRTRLKTKVFEIDDDDYDDDIVDDNDDCCLRSVHDDSLKAILEEIIGFVIVIIS